MGLKIIKAFKSGPQVPRSVIFFWSEAWPLQGTAVSCATPGGDRPAPSRGDQVKALKRLFWCWLLSLIPGRAEFVTDKYTGLYLKLAYPG